MTPASRERGSLHPGAAGEIRRLHLGDAAELFAFLRDKDVWPAPREPDLASFLGRADAVAFGAYTNGRLRSIAACVLEPETLRIVWVIKGPKGANQARCLLAEVEKQAAARGASLAFAQVAADSQAHRLLVECGYAEDFQESGVESGRTVRMLDLVKPL